MKILVLNGPNLDRLGLREPAIYGSTTLKELEQRLAKQAKAANLDLECQQSNSESELIAKIHQATDEKIAYIIINPAAFSHTSIALRDAIIASQIPFIEVHISNIYARESFRKHSYFSDIAKGVLTGFGITGYSLALDAIIEELKS